MGVLTTNYSFNKPTIGGDEDSWGDDYSGGDPLVDASPGLNGNWEKMDQLFKQQEDILAQLEIDVGNIPADLDALNVQVGALYVSMTDADPATTLGYGTWEAWGLGRALVGVGNNTEHDWIADEELGSSDHTLLAAETPAHTHTVPAKSANTNSTGSHRHSYEGVNSASGTARGGSSGATAKSVSSGTAGSHTHTLDLASFTFSPIGGDEAHANEQSAASAYIWKRLT